MYLPKYFEQSDTAALLALAREHPLATLVLQGQAGLLANHIPLHVDDEFKVLRGHVARANPLWQELGAGVPALAIFHGAEAYVSPSLYPGKTVHGEVVPTWNYAVVHAHGQLRAVEDRDWLRALLDTLTASHEQLRPQPWQLDDAPRVYVERMLAAVVGIELQVATLTGKFKLSQNREPADRSAVQEGVACGELRELMAAAERARSGG